MQKEHPATSLDKRFLDFQSAIHQELNNTRKDVTDSQRLISDHGMKTLESITKLGETINKITSQQEEAHKLGQSLKDILQAPKLRGNYGEAILEELLDRALPKGIWERQYSIEGREAVDAVVKFKDIVIPIDAKFPREAYLRYIEESSPDEKKEHWKKHEEAVKKHVDDIKEKYIKPEKGTSEFAIMFIPSEAIYYETIAERNHLGEPSILHEYAQKNHVFPASPNTFYAFLQIVVMGTRNLEMIKSVKKLQENLSALQKSFGFFYKKYEAIGKNIENASEAYRVGDGHIDRYKRRLDSTLQLEAFDGEVDQLPESASDEGD